MWTSSPHVYVSVIVSLKLCATGYLLRQKLKAAQKLLKSERKKVKKERNLFKKKVEDSTKNILNFQKKQKKTSPTFQKLLQLMNN